VILKAHEGYRAYRDMLHYYAMKNLLAYMQENPQANLEAMRGDLAPDGRLGRSERRQKRWVNLGGQLMQADDVEQLKADIRDGSLDSWPAIHDRCDVLWERYNREKQRHAFATLLDLHELDDLTSEAWNNALDEMVRIQHYVRDQTYATRRKDYDNHFRQVTFASAAEMEAVMGSAEENSFVKQVGQETEELEQLISAVRGRG